MAVFAKTLSKEWRSAFEEYELITGIGPIHKEDIDAGTMPPGEAWNLNV